MPTGNGTPLIAKPLALLFLSAFFLWTHLVFPAAAGATEGGELEAVLKRLEEKASNFETLQSSFRQKKRMAAFKSEVELEGRLFVDRSRGRIAWHVDRPLRYSVLITEDFIRQWDEETGKAEEISLFGKPALKAALEQINVWFSGRYSQLFERYETELTGRSPLSLTFRAKSGSAASQMIDHITITFTEDERALTSLSIHEKSGDRTVIEFLETWINEPLPEGAFEVDRG